MAVAARSSLNDGATSVKNEIIKRDKEENIEISGEKFHVSWEEHDIDGITISTYTVLAPAVDAELIKHVILLLAEPTNNRTEYPNTHNYRWYALQRSDRALQLRTAVNHQHRFLCNRQFVIIDGMRSNYWANLVPPKTFLLGDNADGNTDNATKLLLSASNLFNDQGTTSRPHSPNSNTGATARDTTSSMKQKTIK